MNKDKLIKYNNYKKLSRYQLKKEQKRIESITQADRISKEFELHLIKHELGGR